MIWFIAVIGSRRWQCCIRPTISRSSPAASARRRAACTLNINVEPWASSRSSISSSTGLGKRLGQAALGAEDRQKVAIVGSGPAGLAAAQQLARRPHDRLVFEKEQPHRRPAALQHPDFKLDKAIIDRRMQQMEAEGVTFHQDSAIGSKDFAGRHHQRCNRSGPPSSWKEFDAVILAAGSEVPRDLPIPGANWGVPRRSNF